MAKLTIGDKSYDVPVTKEKDVLELMMMRSTYLDISIDHFKKHAKYNPDKDEINFDDFECALAYISLLEEARFMIQVEAFKKKNAPHIIAIFKAMLEIQEKGQANARKNRK